MHTLFNPSNTATRRKTAEASIRNQGFPPCRAPEGRAKRHHQEAEEWFAEVQGAMLEVPLHPRREGQREG